MTHTMNAEKSTFGTTLVYYETESQITEITEILEYPDMGGTPSTIEITSLKDTHQRFIPGVKEQDTYEFTCLYTIETLAKLKVIRGEEKRFGLWLGIDQDGVPTGNLGRFEFTGVLDFNLVGGAVNDARTLNVSIIPSSEVEEILPEGDY